MAERINQSVALKIALKAYQAGDHVSPATGQTIGIQISINGGAFGNPSAGTVDATEIGNGWYWAQLSSADTGTLGPLIVRGTCSGVDDVEAIYDVVATNVTVGGYATGQDPAALLAAPLASLQSHGDSTWATATGFSTSTQATALLSAVNNLNNLSALANLFGPSTMVPPASGNQLYAFTLTIRNSEGTLVAADATPTITAQNLESANLNARVSAPANPQTGVYTFTYSVASTDLGSALADEISLSASCTVGGAGRLAILSVALAAAEPLTNIASILSICNRFNFDSGNNVKAIVEAYASGEDPATLLESALALLATAAALSSVAGNAATAAGDAATAATQATAAAAQLGAAGAGLTAITGQTNKIGTNAMDSPNAVAAQTSAATAATQAASAASAAATAATQAAGAATALGTAGSGLTNLPPVSLTSAYNLYLADVNFTKNSTTSTDEYTVVWSKNGLALNSGVAAAEIQVNNQDGSTLLAQTAMVGPNNGIFYHNETASRTTAGAPVDVVVTATIDGSTRTFSKTVGRDA